MIFLLFILGYAIMAFIWAYIIYRVLMNTPEALDKADETSIIDFSFAEGIIWPWSMYDHIKRNLKKLRK